MRVEPEADDAAPDAPSETVPPADDVDAAAPPVVEDDSPEGADPVGRLDATDGLDTTAGTDLLEAPGGLGRTEDPDAASVGMGDPATAASDTVVAASTAEPVASNDEVQPVPSGDVGVSREPATKSAADVEVDDDVEVGVEVGVAEASAEPDSRPAVVPRPPGRDPRPSWWLGHRSAGTAAVVTPPPSARIDAEPSAASTALVEASVARTDVGSTATADAPVVVGDVAAPLAPADGAAPLVAPTARPTAGATSGDTRRLDHWFAAHGSALLWLVPVMVIAGAVTAFALTVSARTAQEALYTGYVYDFLTYGDVAPFTAWVQHPPLGWMQMAAYVQASGALDRWDTAVLAVRESMVVSAAATAGAAWLLARRCGLTRLVATVAAAVLTLSPFALAQHATVSLENVAAPWLVVAFVLATSRRMQPLSFALSAASFAVAVMSAETAVVALPFLAWVMVTATRRGARVWPIVAAAATVQVLAGLYLALASREPAAVPPVAPVFAAVTAGASSLATWWASDPVLLVAVVVGAAAGLVIRPLRPLATLALLGVAVLALPGVAMPDGFAALVLPFAVVVLVGATADAVRMVRAHGVQRSIPAAALAAVVALGVVVSVSLAVMRLPAVFAAGAGDPETRAEGWLLDNVDRDAPVLVDETGRVDFVQAGWARDQVITYPSGDDELPATWTGAQWAVVPAALADEASDDSVVVASFGDVDVRRVLPGSVGTALSDEADRAELRATLGVQLVENPDLQLAAADRELLSAGEVDDRIVSVLGALTIFGPIEVAGFPVVAGEGDRPRREVALAAAGGNPLVQDGELTEAGRDVIGGLLERYTPQSSTVRGGVLVLRYPITLGEPADITFGDLAG